MSADHDHASELALLEDERTRLEVEIAAAEERLAAAKQRVAQRDADARAALRAEIVAARNTIAEMERLHAEAIEQVRESARLEVERILEEARRAAEAAGHPRAGSSELDGWSAEPEQLGPSRS